MPYCNHSVRFVVMPAFTGNEVTVGMFLLQLLTDCAWELVLATCREDGSIDLQCELVMSCISVVRTEALSVNRLFIVVNDIHLIPCISKKFSLPQHSELLCCSPGLMTNT